jgi:hypothetical protein
MISITRKKFGIPINDVFFAGTPEECAHPAAIQFFVQARSPHKAFTPFKTQAIDLTASADELSKALSKNTRYKINRAEREGLSPRLAVTPSASEAILYADFYDTFAAQKRLPPCNRAKLQSLANSQFLILSSVSDLDGSLLAAHAYVKDPSEGRVRLLHSASHFRGMDDSTERNKIGRANRLLHWFEILSLKNAGFRLYDLGGIPNDDSDPEKNAIARFKLEFGGTPLIEYNGFVPRTNLGKILVPFARRRR